MLQKGDIVTAKPEACVPQTFPIGIVESIPRPRTYTIIWIPVIGGGARAVVVVRRLFGRTELRLYDKMAAAGFEPATSAV